MVVVDILMVSGWNDTVRWVVWTEVQEKVLRGGAEGW